MLAAIRERPVAIGDDIAEWFGCFALTPAEWRTKSSARTIIVVGLTVDGGCCANTAVGTSITPRATARESVTTLLLSARMIVVSLRV
jgi:hypothetical protein